MTRGRKPVLSIITVVYNGEKTILPTIQSVEAQTFKDFEYLIIDGNSKDRTLQIIKKHHSIITTLLSEPDSGVYDAMNKGLQSAKGKYVLFLNAGDELASPSTLIDIFSNSAAGLADLIYGETIILNDSRVALGTRTQLTSRKLPKQLVKEDFLNGQIVSHQSFIARRELCEPYNLKYACSADIEWMLQVVEKSTKIVNVGFPISKYLQGGISDKKLLQCWKERFYILLKHFPVFKVLWKHVGFALRFMKIGAYKKDS